MDALDKKWRVNHENINLGRNAYVIRNVVLVFHYWTVTQITGTAGPQWIDARAY